MLEIKKLKVSYGKKEVLKELSMKFSPGKIHGILGVNGAGKTTLFQTIYGFKKADEGDRLFENKTIENHQVSFLETSNYFYPMMTGMEYLQLLGIKSERFSIKKWNQLFELPLNEYVENYSTGMKKKLSFIGVMGMDRPILILDEPFNGVDIESNEKILQILLRLKSTNKIIIIASHIIESLTRICDQIDVLDNGKIKISYQRPDFPKLEEDLKSNVQSKINDALEGLIG